MRNSEISLYFVLVYTLPFKGLGSFRSFIIIIIILKEINTEQGCIKYITIENSYFNLQKYFTTLLFLVIASQE